MKSITEILGNSQILLDISYNLQDNFEDYLSNMHRSFLAMLRVVLYFSPNLEKTRYKTGRRGYDFLPLLKAFLAKSFFKLNTNIELIDRLKSDSSLRHICGFNKVPSPATFSRYFAKIANSHMMEQIHNSMVKEYHQDHIVGHISRDSTAITARESTFNKKKDAVKENTPLRRKPGRPKKGEIIVQKEELRLSKQLRQPPSKSLKQLNKNCAWGGKKNSKGKTQFWPGYKLHLDVTDLGIPITAVVTGANVHDSQVAIPMEKLTERKVHSLYSLMDAAYDAPQIRYYIRKKGRVDLIDFNKRRKLDMRFFDPSEKKRYNIRSVVERANSHLKDWFIPDKIYVKGYKKVNCVLITGVLCLSAVKILQYFHLPEAKKAA